MSAREMTVAAHAKLNVRLKVIAREDSGYHSIETIFHKLTLADEIVVRLRPPGTSILHCTTDVGPVEQNLAFKAVHAFCRAAHWETGFDIHITKRIPVRGGLGGGSADAAATLRALNALAPTPLSPHALLSVAATIGADVPFLTSDAVMALAWGRGDRFLTLDALPQRHVVLIVPSFGINTAEAYQWVDESQGNALEPLALRPWHLANWDQLAPFATNDLTSVAATRHPSITQYITELQRGGAHITGMTGSGSVVFGIFSTSPDLSRFSALSDCQILQTQTVALRSVR